jgi:DNA-directed RNA polymerase specialized sigma24 family protein
MASVQQVSEFEALRPQLLAVAYRLTSTFADGADPLGSAVVAAERLTPDQRVAFVLHDGFGVRFAETSCGDPVHRADQPMGPFGWQGVNASFPRHTG